MNKKIKVGLIGAGSVAKHHLNVLKDFPDVNITSICRRNQKLCKQVAIEYSIPNFYIDYKKMIDEQNLDAVLITVSTLNLIEVSTYCLQKKIPILIEKPPGLKPNNVRKLIKTATKNKCWAIVGLNRRFYSVINKAKEEIEKNGSLISLKIEAPELIQKARDFGNHPEIIYENWIYANGIHCIDLLRFLGGEIIQTHSFAKSIIEKKGDSFGALINFKNGAIGHYISNWQSPGNWSIDLYGQDIKVELKPLESGIILKRNNEPLKILPDELDLKYKPGFYLQNRYFIDCIKNNDEPSYPASNLDDALKTMELIETIRYNG